jgi:hypothetical protein
MRWAGVVARVMKGRDLYRVLVGILWERKHWGDPGVNGRMIIRRVFNK